MTNLLSFINNYKLQSQNQNQIGGNHPTNKLILILFAIMCLTKIALPSIVDNSLQVISSDKTEQFQKEIISFLLSKNVCSMQKT